MDFNQPYLCCHICFKGIKELARNDGKLLLTSCAHTACNKHLARMCSNQNHRSQTLTLTTLSRKPEIFTDIEMSNM